MESNLPSRVTDLYDEPVDHCLVPIRGYENLPLLPLIETVKPVSKLFNRIEDYVFIALRNCQNPSDRLDQQESAAIQLYTMQFRGGPSLYKILNETLRTENREALQPWFLYLKLFLTALYKLPSESKTVWRGIKNVDLSSKYKRGIAFVWWGVSSCNTNIEILESNTLMGKTGVRTIFSIECIDGKSVVNHSYFKQKEDEIILMPGSYFKVIGQLNPVPELHIIQLKQISPPIKFIEPLLSSSNDKQPITVLPPTSSDRISETEPLQPVEVSPLTHPTRNDETETLQKSKSETTSRHRSTKRKIIISIGICLCIMVCSIVTTVFILISTFGSLRIQQIQAINQFIIPRIDIDQKWIQIGVTVAGGYGNGEELNQFSHPKGFFIDDDQTIYVADTHNHRIMEWKKNATNGRIVAGGNGQGERDDQLDGPTNVIIDKTNDIIIICDRGNSRVMRWSRKNYKSGEIIISNIDCSGLIMDNYGYLYISDIDRHEVSRWKIGDKEGIKVAGGNGRGNGLNQLSYPYYFFLDQDQSVYVSDYYNHRVMKWIQNAKEGIVVAGGHSDENSLRQLSSPNGIVVDQLGTLYVVDSDKHHVTRWLKGALEGSVIVGGNEQGEQSNLLNTPMDLTFDRQNNLYVVDSENHRIQRFDTI